MLAARERDDDAHLLGAALDEPQTLALSDADDPGESEADCVNTAAADAEANDALLVCDALDKTLAGTVGGADCVRLNSAVGVGDGEVDAKADSDRDAPSEVVSVEQLDALAPAEAAAVCDGDAILVSVSEPLEDDEAPEDPAPLRDSDAVLLGPDEPPGDEVPAADSTSDIKEDAVAPELEL